VAPALIVAGAIIGIAVAWLPKQPRREVRPRPPLSDVGLHVDRDGDLVRVTWNRKSADLEKSGGAVLRIDDGGQQRNLELDAHQVRNGSVTYYAATSSVSVSMQPGLPSPIVTPPQPAPVLPTEQVAINKPAVVRKRPTPARVKENPRPFTMARASAHRETTEGISIEPPPRLDISTDARPPASLTARRRPGSYAAAVTYEPVKPHALRRAMNRIPGLKLLTRKGYKDGENFSAARPLRQIAPTVPSNLQPEIAELDVKVSIDDSGKISRTQVLSEAYDERLEQLAKNALHRWEFAPARLNEKAVPSEMILHFDFKPPR
jgi:outer membrane biosynthesis protein TonB